MSRALAVAILSLLARMASDPMLTAEAKVVEHSQISEEKMRPEAPITPGLGTPFDPAGGNSPDLRGHDAPTDKPAPEEEGTPEESAAVKTKEAFLLEAIEIVLESDALPLSEADVRQVFRDHGVAEHTPYDGTKMQPALERIENAWAGKRGHKPEIRKQITFTGPASVKLRLILRPSDEFYIRQITFRGNQVFRDSELKAALKMVKEGDLYSGLGLEAALETNIRELYQARGYIKVVFGEPRIQREGQAVNIEVWIQEGDPYQLGDLKITGNTVFATEALLPLFAMKPGDVINITKIRDGLETIKKLYGARGYINWSYQPEQTEEETRRRLNVSLTFQEGLQYRVRRIQFSGQSPVLDSVLRENFLLQEQDIFNSEWLERSIVRLNRLGIFAPIEETDYEVHPDERGGQVDIRIRLKEKQ